MKKTFLSPIKLLVLIFVLLTACNMPRQPSVSDPGAISTFAAQTVAARLTPETGSATATPAELVNDDPQETEPPIQPTSQAPSATPAPEGTSQPEPSPDPTEEQIPCNRAEFVRDITIPDGTELEPGERFTKTWRLKNTGSCTWTLDYAMIFVGGSALDGDPVPFPEEVKPGNQIDLSVDLVAPEQSGDYRGEWMLRDASNRFGLGKNRDKSFWVQIEVVSGERPATLNFVDDYCSAEWESSAGELDCPGRSRDDEGFVVFLEEPDLESRHENEPALWTQPDEVENGWISGTFPAVDIKAGDHFLADVGCLDGYPKCDVIFQVSYRANGGAIQLLKETREAYEGNMTRIDLDLSNLAGQSVEIILTVRANGSPSQDAAFWLLPHIRR